LPTASGSKIASTPTKKNYASQSRRGLDHTGASNRLVKPLQHQPPASQLQ
jgi:hypothetical protein